MYDAALAKYKTCKEAAAILKATNSAQLWHIQMRKAPIRFDHLEKVREQI
jgi:hypothetical protein